MIDLCIFLVKDAQNKRKSCKHATENRYPDTGKCQRKIKIAIPMRNRDFENKTRFPDAGQTV